MKHKKELMLSMLQELIKENDLFFQLFSKHGEQKLPFFSFIFVLLFLKIQLHLPHFQLFFFQFCLLFILFWQHFNCWLSARPSNFPFSSCRNKLPKKEKKCCIYLYKRATKASSPYLPPGVGKKIQNHSGMKGKYNQCGRKLSLSNNIKIMDLLSPLDEQSSSWGKLSKMFT